MGETERNVFSSAPVSSEDAPGRVCLLELPLLLQLSPISGLSRGEAVQAPMGGCRVPRVLSTVPTQVETGGNPGCNLLASEYSPTHLYKQNALRFPLILRYISQLLWSLKWGEQYNLGQCISMLLTHTNRRNTHCGALFELLYLEFL